MLAASVVPVTLNGDVVASRITVVVVAVAADVPDDDSDWFVDTNV